MLIWGFTAGLLTVLLSVGGWDRPWDSDDVRDLDAAWRAAEALAPMGQDSLPADAEVRR
jgi:hypothetical protein